MSSLSEVEREVYISQEWLDSVTTALSNVLSWRIIKLWKKQQKKAIYCICIFCFIGLRNSNSFAAAILRFIMSRLRTGGASLGFRRHAVFQLVSRAWTSTSLRGCLSLLVWRPSSLQLCQTFNGLCLRLNLIWKVSAKMMTSFLRVRLRENVMPSLKYSYRHFPEKL